MPCSLPSDTGSSFSSGAGFYGHPPPVGLPALSVEELLQPCQARIARIKLCYGLDQQGFDAELLPLIRGYAAYVHLLPATPDQPFAEPGGLLRRGLDVGFYSLQGSDGHIFSGRSTISVRHRLEPLWRTATFIGGLCIATHTVLNQISVFDPGGNIWPACVQPLSSWLNEQAIKRYTHRWKAPQAPVQALNLFALPHIVPPALLHRLAHDNETVIPHLFACLSGIALAERNILNELVRQASALVLEQEIAQHAQRCQGQPVEAEPTQEISSAAVSDHVVAAPATVDTTSSNTSDRKPATKRRLNAPLRLETGICRALEAVLQALDKDSSNDAVLLSDGIFIPLNAFSTHHVDPASAIRAMKAASMLDVADGQQNAIVQQEINGRCVAGIVLPQRYLATDPGEGQRHASV